MLQVYSEHKPSSVAEPSLTAGVYRLVASLGRLVPSLLLVWVCLLPARASATDVQGTLTTHTVWKKSGSPYILTGDVTVDWGVRLTIEAGVEVIAETRDALESGVDARRVELIVDGALVVKGTEARPVTFTAPGGSGSWYGIRVRGGRGTVIDGAVITQARRGVSLGMSAVVRNTSVRDTSGDCLQVSWGKATLEGNRLSGCGRNGLRVDEWAKARVEATVVTRSGRNGIELHGGGELRHNTIHANAASGVALFSRRETPVVEDSLLTSNGGHGAYMPSTARGVLRSNNVWGNGAGDHGAAASPGPRSLSEDPLYVSSSDLRLRADSPARGRASEGRDLGAFQTPRLPEGPDTRSALLVSANIRGRQVFSPARRGGRGGVREEDVPAPGVRVASVTRTPPARSVLATKGRASSPLVTDSPRALDSVSRVSIRAATRRVLTREAVGAPALSGVLRVPLLADTGSLPAPVGSSPGELRPLEVRAAWASLQGLGGGLRAPRVVKRPPRSPTARSDIPPSPGLGPDTWEPCGRMRGMGGSLGPRSW